ncbi:MAG: ATPase domain-containing protein [Pyrobaculum sp.]
MKWISQVTSSSALRQCLEELAGEGKIDLTRFAMLTPMEVADLCGVDESIAENAIRKARQLAGYSPVKVVKRGEKADVIKTGIAEFDEKTPWGGLQRGKIHLFAGKYGTGKSILAMQISASALASGYKPVYYIDTENAFNDKMMDALLRRFLGKSLDEIPESDFTIVKTADVFALTEVIKYEIPPEARVIVVDSIIEPFRAQFKGREKLASRQQWLHYLVDLLRRRTFQGATVILTNQVSARPELLGEEDAPAGGNILLHTANTIWRMRRKGQDGGYIEALDVPGLARGTRYNYTIRDDGLY